jgi:alkyl hydroperoxide reductase subunit AhpC
VVQLHHRRSEFEALNAKILVVGFEPADRARAWMRTGEISFPFLLDLNRSVYQAYQIERSIFRSWHPRNLWFYFKRFLRGGQMPKIKADPNQLGGDFIVDLNGIIRLVYYSKDATDRPSVEELLSVLRRINPIVDN